MNIPFCLPENISPETFLRDYWQKRPLLIRNGLPQIVGLFEPEDIMELALEEEITARLIKCENEQWSVKTSPFAESDLQDLPAQFSVMVQNLEQWSPELGALWQAFSFLPQWQRDDIMVSCSPKGGTVGKHYELNLQSKCNKKRSTHQLEYNFVSTQKPLPNDEYFLPTSYNKRARKDNDFTRTGQKTSRNCQSTGT